ncbi:MAG TPA: ATP-binding protein [Pseudomonas sp.]
MTAEAVLESPGEHFWPLAPGRFPVDFSHSAFWLRFSLSAADDSPCMSWLSVGEPRLNNVQVHVRRDSGWSEMHAGRDYPVEQWSTHTRQPLFPLSLDNGEQVDVLARVTSRGVLMISPQLWNDLDLIRVTQELSMVDGVVFGIALLIVPFSLIVGLLIRSRLLLMNTLAILAYVLLASLSNGYLFYLPALLPWSSELSSVLGFAALAMFMGYLQVLFQVHRLPVGWRRAQAVCVLLLGGVLLSGLIFDFTNTRSLFDQLRWMLYLLVPLLCLAGWYHGLRPSWLAWALTILFSAQGLSRYVLGVNNASWQYGEDQLGLVSSLPGVLLLVCTLIMEFSRSRRRERHALAELDAQRNAEHERLENTVERRTEQLRESLRARSSLLARITHDLRSPLSSIIDYARLLRAETRQDYPQKIERNARRQLELIDELLEFSRSELQQQELVLAPGYLYGFLGEIEDEARFFAQRQGNQLHCQFGVDLPPLVQADFRRLRRILVNLLANAGKFTHQGRIDFSVSLVRAEADEVELAFSVRDTGIGIYPDDRADLLQPFSRGRNARRYEGSGLGLSIVNQLLEQMGAELLIDTRPGHGSCFSFHLLLATADEHELDVVMEESRGIAIRGEDRRVLIVDDTGQNRESISDLLGGYGFDTFVAEDGAQALLALEETTFDLLITDQMMPVIDGWQLLSAVRTSYPALPVLLYSAAPPLRPASCSPALAFDAALLKPADGGELLEQIARLLDTA